MANYKNMHGFSLVELMIGLTLGLLVLASVSAVFISTSNTRNEMERAGKQIENGRYAMQLLTDDLRQAGFYGEYDPSDLPTPTTMPNPCTTDTSEMKNALPIHVQGYDLGTSAPTCISDLKPNTDIVVLRRASGCVAGATGCEAQDSDYFYYQTTLCNDQLGEFPSSINHFIISNDNASFTLTKRDCTTSADLRKYITRIYFIANNNVSGDGVPTLKRAELTVAGTTIVPLVEGIENLQLSYGLDTTGNDGVPDVYAAAPETYNGCSGTACVDNWRNAMTVSISLLSKSTETTPGYKDTNTYIVGNDAAGVEQSFGPFNDQYKRHVYDSVVRINNPAGRRE
ncbi:MAG TPA: PilW family protein [Methylophilaceae bacterium]|nr:PilW family protein [Methylophilaceae bacterium]